MSQLNQQIPQLRSLAWRTDLIFPAFEGVILDREEYIVVRTPSNPGFYWGNFLLFRDPPNENDLERWSDLFKEEITSLQPTEHMTFGWDGTDGTRRTPDTFLKAGFRHDQSIVLQAPKLLTSDRESRYDVRPITTADEWSAVVENQVESREATFEETGYRRFRTRSMERYRAMYEAGLGAWFGAFDGDRVVGDLGIYSVDSIARYQSVLTNPAYRRQGIAGSLLIAAGIWARRHLNPQSLVIVTDPDSPAERLYRRHGFRFREWQTAMERW